MSLPRSDAPRQFRILHLVPSIGRYSGGAGAVAIGLAREQSSLGYQADIWTLDVQATAAEVAHEIGLDHRSVITYPTWGPSWLGFSPVMEQAIVSPLGETYDILHQHGIWTPNSRVTKRWRATFRRPTIVAPHGMLEEYALKRSTWKKRFAMLGYEADNLRLASCLQATSSAEATTFRRYGLANPIAIIPNGVPEAWIHSQGDASRFCSRFAIPPDRRLLLFLSRIHPIKGLPLLFEALADLRQQVKDWLLVIGGPDECGHARALQALAQRLNIENLVRFVGPLFGQDKRAAFAAADLFVLPTHSENFGIVVVEALGAGVPVLTTHGAPWEELETYRCGWWVDVSAMAIRDALLDATQHPKDELVAVGERGRTLVAEHYTWPVLAQRSLMLYNWLLGHAKHPEFVLCD